MNALQTTPRRRKADRRPAREVQRMLLELAYLLNTTRVVKRLPRKPKPS